MFFSGCNLRCVFCQNKVLQTGQLGQAFTPDALADAMLLRPRVLLLDDFLSGLDRDLRVSSESIITNIAAFAGVVVTGHELADMSKWTTRFLVLRDGKITHTVSSAGIDRESLVAKVDAALSGGAQ